MLIPAAEAVVAIAEDFRNSLRDCFILTSPVLVNIERIRYKISFLNWSVVEVDAEMSVIERSVMVNHDSPLIPLLRGLRYAGTRETLQEHCPGPAVERCCLKVLRGIQVPG
jgi:hypothetical protein